MQKYLPIVIATLFSLSCSQPTVENGSKSSKQSTGAKMATKPDSLHNGRTAEPDTSKDGYPGWVDTLVTSYIKNAKNDLVKYAVTHHMKEEWVLDDRKKTDSANYWVFNVGHDVSEPDGTETRYISDSWVYVDSLKRKIYEYDPANEKLVEWKK